MRLFVLTVQLSPVTQQAYKKALYSIGGLILALAVVALFLLWYRRRCRRIDAESDPVTGGFGLSDLRRLRDSNAISNEEYERAKALIIARYKAIKEAKEAESQAQTDDKANSSQ